MELGLSSVLSLIAGLLVYEILLQRTFAVNVTGRVLDTEAKRPRFASGKRDFGFVVFQISFNPKTVPSNFRVL